MMHARTTLTQAPLALTSPFVSGQTTIIENRPSRVRSDSGKFLYDVSICIPNWNCKDYLRACLESLREGPQGVRLEVIVVDNHSWDGAPEMVVADFPEVVLIRNHENVGFARASNQAAAVANGKYLFFLNNDTIVPPGTIRQLLDFAEDHPDVGLIGPRLIDPRGNLQISYRNKPTVGALLHRTMLFRWTGLLRRGYYRYRRDDFDPRCTREVDVLMGAALLIRRDRFEAFGRWDEEFRFGGEDIELSVRVGKEHRLIYLADAEIIHHGRISSRENISFAAANVTIGYVHYFRRTGSSRLGILAYKCAVTIDSPFQLLSKLAQCGYRLARGQKNRARKSWLVVKGIWHFMTKELGRFWAS